MPSGGKADVTHDPGRGGLFGQYACRVQRTSRPLFFSGQGMYGSFAVHRVDGCARMRCIFIKYMYPLEDQGNKRTTTAQAECTTTSTERRAHLPAHIVAAKNLAASIYISAPSVGCSQRCG